jgi:outer membrane protein OmpA-like peptidoglycan-associated protein
MKSRFVSLLALAVTLSLTAAAQQQSTSSSSAPASQPAATSQQQQTDQQSNQTTPSTQSNQPQDTSSAQSSQQASSSQSSDQASSHQPLTYEKHEGFWGKINPFARKKYVQRQLDPVRDRLNELDELTAKNASLIKDVDSRATEGIKAADSKASTADQHAVDAGNRAQAAQQTAEQTGQKLQNVEQVVTNIDQYKPATQVELMFRPGQVVLSQKAKTALDEMAQNLKDQRGYIVEVQGFSSGRGTAAVQNSQKMADAVVRYLVLNHEVPVYRIYTLGMGNVPAPVSATSNNARPRRTTGGRVEVSLLKNEGLSGMQTASTGSPQSSIQNNAASSYNSNASQSAMPQSSEPNQQQPASQPKPKSNEKPIPHS